MSSIALTLGRHFQGQHLLAELGSLEPVIQRRFQDGKSSINAGVLESIGIHYGSGTFSNNCFNPFSSLIGILLWKTRCANCGTLGFAGYEEIFEETQDAEYKMEYKIFKCKTCGIEKKRIIYRKDPLSASPKPDNNGFYKALSGSRKPGSVWWRSEKK